MNRQAILQSNLLDIIFENRNKDYGAYKLRKTYQNRLSVAVFSAVGCALIASLFLLPGHSSGVFIPVQAGIYVPGAKIHNYQRLPQPGNKKMVMQHVAVKSNLVVERPPMIVASDKINTLPATPGENQSSFTGTSVTGMNLAFDADGNDKGGLDGNAAAGKTNSPGPDKSIPVVDAEIMP